MSELPNDYWGWDLDQTVVLQALRRFRAAEDKMRRELSAGMRMNLRDVEALQHVIAAEMTGELASPREIAEHLGISTASTTKLLDRLTESGHVERVPNQRDRRSLAIRATTHAHDEVRERLAEMHARLEKIAQAVPEHCRPAVIDFLAAMTKEMEYMQALPALRPANHPKN